MFQRIREVGAWLFNSVIEPSELEQLDRNQSRAIDGHGGGAYAPSSPIDVGGAGIRVLTPSHADQVTPKGYVDGQIAPVSARANASILAGSARYTIPPTPADGSGGTSEFPLVEAFADDDFVLVDGNKIAVPAGRYLVTFVVVRHSTSTDNPLELAALVGVAGGEFVASRSHRWSDNPAHLACVSGSGPINVGSGQHVRVAISGGGGIQNPSYFSLTRISS